MTNNKSKGNEIEPVRPEIDAAPVEFCKAVADLLRDARSNSYRAVNFIMVEAYWKAGRMSVR